MFFLDTTPDTTLYMIAGYAVIFGVMLIYLASLAIRYRSLHQDIETYKELEDEGEKQKQI